MLLTLVLGTALAAPQIDGVPLDVAQGIWQIEMFRLPPATLRGWLEDRDPAIRARAVRALGRLRDGERGPAMLSKVAADPDPQVRREVAFALGQTPGSRRTIEERWSRETDREVRDALAIALGKQGDRDAVALLVAALPTLQAAAAAEGLGRLAMRKVDGAVEESVASRLLDHLGGPFAPAHARVGWALGRLGLTTASETTIRRLEVVAREDDDADVRAWAVRAWAPLPAGATRSETLGRLLADPDAGVRIAAVRAVARTCPEDVAGVLGPAFDDKEADVRLEAIAALGSCPAAVAGPLLRPYLAVPEALTRAAALRAAVAADALDVPLDRFLDPDQPLLVRTVAAESLSDPKRLVAIALTATEAPVRSAAAGAILAADEPRLGDLLELLTSADTVLAQGAADKLGEKPDPTMEKPLLDRLARGDLAPPEVVTLLKALAKVYATGTVHHPVPGAARLVKPWLGLPALGEAATTLADTLDLSTPDVDHPTLRLPPLAEVLAIRSARLLTSEGEIRVTLDAEEAPYTVWNFARLADQGYFDGIVFHRVVADFVIQAGDPRGDGWGGPGYEIPDEINPLPYDVGALGMALSGPDTGGSQWFITLSPQPHLEGTYTVFGHVDYGMRNAAAVLIGARIEHIIVERVPWNPT